MNSENILNVAEQKISGGISKSYEQISNSIQNSKSSDDIEEFLNLKSPEEILEFLEHSNKNVKDWTNQIDKMKNSSSGNLKNEIEKLNDKIRRECKAIILVIKYIQRLKGDKLSIFSEEPLGLLKKNAEKQLLQFSTQSTQIKLKTSQDMMNNFESIVEEYSQSYDEAFLNTVRSKYSFITESNLTAYSITTFIFCTIMSFICLQQLIYFLKGGKIEGTSNITIACYTILFVFAQYVCLITSDVILNRKLRFILPGKLVSLLVIFLLINLTYIVAMLYIFDNYHRENFKGKNVFRFCLVCLLVANFLRLIFYYIFTSWKSKYVPYYVFMMSFILLTAIMLNISKFTLSPITQGKWNDLIKSFN